MAGASGSGRFLLPLVSACIALAVIGIAAPRVVAYGFIASQSNLVPRALAEGRQIDAEPLERAVADYRDATGWLPSDGLLQQDFARLLMRQERRRDAIEALRASLAAAPNRAFAWSLLASLEDEAGGRGDRLVPMVRLSFETGPREASSMLLRPRVALDHWSDMPDDLKAATRDELKRLYRTPWMRERFFRLYLAQDFAGRILMRDAVLETPAETEGFNRAIRAAAGLAPAAP